MQRNYKVRAPFMTQAELKLYNLLDSYLPTRLVTISLKVRLYDLIDVDSKDRNIRFKLINQIDKKHIDYVVIDKKTGIVICCIELDDAYHSKPRNKLSDNIKNKALKDAGIPLIRIKTPIKNISYIDIKPIIGEIEYYWKKVYKVNCPICGKRMNIHLMDNTFTCSCGYKVNCINADIKWNSFP